jgi:hypothetical protein
MKGPLTQRETARTIESTINVLLGPAEFLDWLV